MGGLGSVVVLVGIALGVMAMWIYRRRSTGSKSTAGDASTPRKQVAQWGVRIAAPAKERACLQVRGLVGKEFPLSQKPTLPVKDCPFGQHCECHYVKLFDRRQEERRSGRERRQVQRFEKGHHDRRTGKDRRGKPIDWA